MVSPPGLALPAVDFSRHSARQRDIFPLPSFAAQIGDRSGLSRSQKRKAASHDRRSEWFSDGVFSLNQLLGHGSSHDAHIDSFADAAAHPPLRNDGQRLCISRIKEAYDNVPAPPVGMTPAQAFSGLRGTTAGYNDAPSQGARVPFNLESCSMPPPLNCAHPVTQSLAGEPLHEIENWRECILKSQHDRMNYLHGNDRIRPYLDPNLVRDPKVYASFLQKLDRAGILSWRLNIPSWLGICLWQRKAARSASSSTPVT